MNRLKRKLAVNGVATILSVIIILAMVAAPVIASVTANSVDGSSIVDRSIQTIDLALGSVKTGVLGKNAVTSAKIRDRQVKTADLAVGAVGTGRIKNGAVTGAKIRDYSVAKEDLRSRSVNSVKIADGSILARDIANGVVTSAKIADSAIGNTDIADNAITSAKIAAGQVAKTDIAANAINSTKIRDYTVAKQDLRSSSVNSVKIADGSITNKDIAAGAAISDSKISYDTTKTGYYTVAGVGFGGNVTFDNDYDVVGDSSNPYAKAQIQLPDGAKITKFEAWVYDNAASDDTTIALVRSSASTATPRGERMARFNTSSASTTWIVLSETNVAYPVIDNENHGYGVLFAASNNELKLHKVRITYEYRER